MYQRRIIFPLATILGGALLAAACSTSSSASVGTPSAQPTDAPQAAATVQVAAPTTAAVAAAVEPTSTPVPAAPAAAGPTQAAPEPAAPPPPPAATGPQTMALDLEDNYFTSKEVTIPAGTTITMAVHNEGQALHNWDVAGVTKTGFLQHGQTQVVTFTATPGTYNFVCDVHPKEMTGVLIVK